MHRRARAPYAIGAAACIVAFFALGMLVRHNPDPDWLLVWEASLVNHGTETAWLFTNLGYAFVLVPLCLAAIAVAVIRPEWRIRVALSIVCLLVSWQGADFWQHVFARPRRLDWVLKHETAFSFPSSHAAIATGFYGLWGWMLAETKTRAGRYAGALLLLTAVGILWSRLALGAHYITDLLAGILWGFAVVLTGIAIVSPIKVLGSLAERS